ncbi:flagellar motor protein MotB [Desnuesiella massiliensis]|uniref:flagellar motor protein MotB n=1 Tax=Desnuesiella massiliensis TaxID=1650662 RepID=UPI0006E42668|nr:flagellar motor protein MotB [Desnuesiella massiliensis]
MARKKTESNGGPSGQEWLATYSDTVTLLLTFFILLYSFSTVDAQKLKNLSAAMQTVLSGQGGTSILEYNINTGNAPLVGEDMNTDAAQNVGQATDMYSTVKEFIEKNNMQSSVQIKEDERGVIIQLRDNILFESGKADLKDNSKSILDKINSLISTFPNNIIVEGHTDNLPINTFKFESNWELSTARAVNVVRYFVEQRGHNPVRFSAAGYGEFKPVAPNDTADNKAMNRRVNILIVATEKEKKK